MSEETNDIELYFKLKHKYETLLNKKKLKIKKKTKDKNEQKKLFNAIDMKCIHCNKSGGNIFSTKTMW